MRISEAFDAFIEDELWDHNRSVNTQDNYRQANASICKVIGNIPVESVSKAHVRQWTNYMRTHSIAISTERTYKSKLKNVLRYTNKKGITYFDLDDVVLPKLPFNLPTYLTPVEIQKLINAAPLERDKLIIALFFSTGMRVSELCTLKRTDIREDVVRVFGKGAKEREIPLNPIIAARIQLYIASRNDNRPELFTGYRKQALGKDAVERIIRKTGRSIGIKVMPRILRHSFATDLHTNDMDIRDVQYFMGHEFISTTQIYTHIIPKKARIRFLECQTTI